MGFRETAYYDNEGKETMRHRVFISDKFDDKKGYLFWNQANFIKTFHDVELPKELRKVDIANLFLLSKKVYADTNMIGCRGSAGNPKPMTIRQMADVIRDTERHTITFINRMIKLRVLAKVDVKVGNERAIQYYFNPIYFFSSNRLSLNLYLLFQKDLDPFLSNYAKERFSKLKAVNE